MNMISSSWAEAMFRSCWQGGLLILTVAVLCRFARGIPPSMRFWLWWICCLKLVLGMVVTEPLALPILPPHSTIDVFTPSDTVRESRYATHPTDLIPRSHDRAASIGAIQRPPVPSALLAIWIVSCGVGVLLRMWQVMRLRGLVLRSSLCEEPVQDIAGDLACQIRLLRVPSVLVSDALYAPLVAQPFNPVIVLPRAALSDLSTGDIRAVLAHELIHVRRRDLVLSLVPSAAQVLYSFFPPAWWAAREARIAAEQACDLETVRLTQTPASGYGRLLLQFASSSRINGSAISLGGAPGFRALERRLTMLQQSSQSSFKASRAAVIVVMCAMALTLVPWRLTAQTTPSPTGAVAASVPAQPATKTPTAALATAARTPTGKAAGSRAAARPVAKTPATTSIAATSSQAPAATLPAVTASNATVAADQPVAASVATNSIATSAAGTPELAGEYDITLNGDGTLTLDLDDASLFTAIKLILKKGRVDYRLDPDIAKMIGDERVSIRLTHAPIRTALQMILGATRGLQNPLTYRVESSVYIIMPKFIDGEAGGAGGGRSPSPGYGRSGTPATGEWPGASNPRRGSGGFGGGRSVPRTRGSGTGGEGSLGGAGEPGTVPGSLGLGGGIGSSSPGGLSGTIGGARAKSLGGGISGASSGGLGGTIGGPGGKGLGGGISIPGRGGLGRSIGNGGGKGLGGGISLPGGSGLGGSIGGAGGKGPGSGISVPRGSGLEGTIGGPGGEGLGGRISVPSGKGPTDAPGGGDSKGPDGANSTPIGGGANPGGVDSGKVARTRQNPKNAEVPVLGQLPIIGRLFRSDLRGPKIPEANDQKPKIKPAYQFFVEPITLNLLNVDLRYALSLLFQNKEIKYALEPGIRATVTASFKDTPFESALQLLIKSAQIEGAALTYRVENGVVLIGRQAHV